MMCVGSALTLLRFNYHRQTYVFKYFVDLFLSAFLDIILVNYESRSPEHFTDVLWKLLDKLIKFIGECRPILYYSNSSDVINHYYVVLRDITIDALLSVIEQF